MDVGSIIRNVELFIQAWLILVALGTTNILVGLG
jgi:hypothetical protein